MAGLVGTFKPKVAAAKNANGRRRGSTVIIPGVRASVVA
jgi:hypothetical protein